MKEFVYRKIGHNIERPSYFFLYLVTIGKNEKAISTSNISVLKAKTLSLGISLETEKTKTLSLEKSLLAEKAKIISLEKFLLAETAKFSDSVRPNPTICAAKLIADNKLAQEYQQDNCT